MAYVKLFNTILRSTIWQEPLHVKVVWITMLALSDKDGDVMSSIPGLASTAGVTIPQAKEALESFLGPDEYSGTKAFEGRRIEPISGGWHLLNHGKYRALLSAEERREYNRQKQADRRRRLAEMSKNVNDSQPQSAKSAHTDTKAESNPLPKQSKAAGKFDPLKVELPFDSDPFRDAWNLWVQHRIEKKQKLTETSVRLQFKSFSEIGEQRAIAAIKHTIVKGWQGIFEPTGPGGKPTTPATSTRTQAEEIALIEGRA